MLYFTPTTDGDPEFPLSIQGESIDSQHVTAGPDGQPGLVSTARGVSGNPACTSYRPETQDWLRIHDGLWIGEEANARIDPMNVLRKFNSGGVIVIDEWARSWIIPIARSDYDRVTLQRRYAPDLEGGVRVTWVNELAAEIFRDAERCYAWKYGEEIIDHVERYHIARRAIQLNYMLSDAEFALLESRGENPLRSEFIAKVCEAIADVPFKEAMDAEVAKKNQESA